MFLSGSATGLTVFVSVLVGIHSYPPFFTPGMQFNLPNKLWGLLGPQRTTCKVTKWSQTQVLMYTRTLIVDVNGFRGILVSDKLAQNLRIIVHIFVIG